jgi:excisionase family DNA binding protein
MQFNKQKKIIQEEENSKSIDINAEMQGSLIFRDAVNLKINGQFKGTLDTKGTLTIGSSAQVDANINGENIVIAGKVVGDVHANKMLVLMPTAILHGNITTPKLNIVEGAMFQGRCQMNTVGAAETAANNGLLDINEVAKYLEIDLNEIERLANTGKIPGTKSGNTWKFERNQIENWAASGKLS